MLVKLNSKGFFSEAQILRINDCTSNLGPAIVKSSAQSNIIKSQQLLFRQTAFTIKINKSNGNQRHKSNYNYRQLKQLLVVQHLTGPSCILGGDWVTTIPILSCVFKEMKKKAQEMSKSIRTKIKEFPTIVKANVKSSEIWLSVTENKHYCCTSSNKHHSRRRRM